MKSVSEFIEVVPSFEFTTSPPTPPASAGQFPDEEATWLGTYSRDNDQQLAVDLIHPKEILNPSAGDLETCPPLAGGRGRKVNALLLNSSFNLKFELHRT